LSFICVLKETGFGEPLLTWFRSYIDNRKQWVKIHGICSTVLLNSSGVLQGGHLSPLIFSLFINSNNKALKQVHFLAFADDIKLFYQVNSLNDCLILQNYFNNLISRATKLGLKFNTSKCHSMIFKRKSSPVRFNYTVSGSSLVPLNKSVNDLGFVFDLKLNPNLHIEQVCCKALKTLGFVKRVATEFKLVFPLKALYCSLVRPILEYGSVIWDPQTACNSVMLERV
jgi:hypothetical protein